MKRTPLLLIPALALAAGACGGSDGDAIDVGAAPTTSVVAEPADLRDDEPGVAVTIWFNRGEALVPVDRVVPDTGDLEAAAADALRSLLEGPSNDEREDGLTTAIPVGTRLLGLEVGDDRIATVDLSGEFETGGGTAAMRARLGQVACTLDDVVALDIVDGTRFELDGKPVSVFSGEGIVLDGPVTCADYHAPEPTGGSPSPPTTVAPRPSAPSTTAVPPAAPDVDHRAGAAPVQRLVLLRGGVGDPGVGDSRRKDGLDLLRISAGTTSRFVVEDLRYFTGPDGPGVIEPRHDTVERWYVKASVEDEPDLPRAVPRGAARVGRAGSSPWRRTTPPAGPRATGPASRARASPVRTKGCPAGGRGSASTSSPVRGARGRVACRPRWRGA
jgi:hypothetical protein